MDDVACLTRLGDPATRRLWLLTQALRCVPLDKAVELARVAEGFITAAARLETKAGSGEPAAKTVPTECGVAPANGCDPTLIRSSAHKPTPLALSAEQRQQLLDRLAQGAGNAELAQAFSLTARQVQGIRMGAARNIAERRQRVRGFADDAGIPTSPEDVIRYLRQQDDIVVPQEHGPFLVNARFRLDLVELVSRANRMRQRQGKPDFALPNGRSFNESYPPTHDAIVASD